MGKDKDKNAALKKAYKDKMKSKAKERKQNLKQKRARLVVKNLPFTATEENLKTHFERFGKVLSVDVLKREDGKLVGCGFIQFEEVQKAAKAKHHLNGKDFLGRALECDFSMPKTKFDKKKEQEQRQKFWLAQKIKEEPVDVDNIEIKHKVDLGHEEKDVKIEPFDVTDVTEITDDKNNSIDDSDNSEADIKDDKDSDDSSSDADEEDEVKDFDEEVDSGLDEDKPSDSSEKKPRYESHDVNEGKTIFVKNLPFEATNQDLWECMMQFGPVYYALVCVDKMTEHSKGTGFVKFKYKEDADRCLKAGTELTCLDAILDCHPAMGRDEINNKSKEKEKNKQKDSRNLYLIKEGVVLAGTKAAEGVSASDMAKRLQLEQYKTQMLRNLNMFIARTRLIIHNLPATWDDSKLRSLLKKHAGVGAVIRESRVMRDLKKVDANGVGVSKEHGFVSFTTHEHALNALRSLNNNPHVFSESKRPIVAFSIENRVMVNTKLKRMEKSRQLNPLAKQYDPKAKNEHVEFKKRKQEEDSQQGQPKNKQFKQNNTQQGSSKFKSGFGKNNQQGKNFQRRPVDVIDGDEFTGTRAKPGQIHKMRSKFKLTTQAKVHHEQLKAEKKQKKNATKTLQQRKQDFIRQDGQKVNKEKLNRNSKDDSFAKMVNSYKSKLLQNSSGSKLQPRGTWADG